MQGGSMAEVTDPDTQNLIGNVAKLQKELEAAKRDVCMERQRASRAIIEQGVLEQMVDKLIEKLSDR